MRRPKNSHALKEEEASDSSSQKLSYPSRFYTTQHGINNLISAGDQILTLAVNLMDKFQPDDKEKLLQDLIYEIRSFENRAQLANYSQQIINTASYALCTLVDETITLTPWGKKNNWKNQGLVKNFHNRSFTNSKFLIDIENILENRLTKPTIDLVELLYLSLSLRKFETRSRDQKKTDTIIDRLYQTIERHRPTKSIQLLVGKIETSQSTNNTASNGRSGFMVKLFIAATLITLIVNGVGRIVAGNRVDNYLNAEYGFNL